jgi:nitrogen fixation protein NifU and related proteins
MSEDLTDLYQEVVLDHGRRPRNFGKLEGANHEGAGFNPLCGDELKLYLKVEGGSIADIKFEGSGCAISKASASLMTTVLKGKSVAEAQNLFEQFHHMVTHGPEDRPDPQALGKLAVLAGVSEFPTRVKCASLAWHTMKATLEGKGTAGVSTE